MGKSCYRHMKSAAEVCWARGTPRQHFSRKNHDAGLCGGDKTKRKASYAVHRQHPRNGWSPAGGMRRYGLKLSLRRL